MSKKSTGQKSRRSRQRAAFNKAVYVLIIIFAAGYFLYKNVPVFHVFVDTQAEKARTAAEKIFGKNQSQDSAQINKDEHGASGSDASSRQKNGQEILRDVQNDDEPQALNDGTHGQKNEILNQVQNDRNQVQNDNVVALPKNLEFPLCAGADHAADHERRNYEYYSICYRESYEQAEWSAYCLTSEHLVKNASRSDDFRPDPEISTGSASLADYRGSGYDRGHLSPAADFAFDKSAMSETFYMSNMSPQAGGLNRGIWKDLEATVRNWAAEFGRVYVVSGPVLEKPAAEYDSIGKDKVSVPQYYYKALLAPLYADEKDAETPDDAKSVIAIGFIFPNEKCEGDIFDYAVSIDEIEKRTGIDFFNGLSDDIENKIEAEVDVKDWKN